MHGAQRCGDRAIECRLFLDALRAETTQYDIDVTTCCQLANFPARLVVFTRSHLPVTDGDTLMRSPWLLGAAALIALNACGPPREELPTRDGSTRADAAADSGSSGMDAAMNCPTGAARCGTDCVNLQTSTVHCGACNSRCQSGQTCMAGRCQATVNCTAPQTNCGGTCVDVTNNNANCGACGRMCAAGQTCTMGVCMAGGCAAPRMMCGASCIDVSSDNANCGRCGNACAAGSTCVGSTCQMGGGMCSSLVCNTNAECQAACGPSRTGGEFCCSGMGGVCYDSPNPCGGGGGSDGGTSSGDGGSDACWTGGVRCTTDAECEAACPPFVGLLPSSCNSGSCSYF